MLEAQLSSTQDALTANERSLAATQRSMGATQRSLEASERKLAVARGQMVVRPSRIRKASGLLAENPRQGSVRIVRAIVRRWRR